MRMRSECVDQEKTERLPLRFFIIFAYACALIESALPLPCGLYRFQPARLQAHWKWSASTGVIERRVPR